MTENELLNASLDVRFKFTNRLGQAFLSLPTPFAPNMNEENLDLG
jgi:hypothetical protein